MSCERPTPATAFLPQLQTPSKPSWLAQTAEFRKELLGKQRLRRWQYPANSYMVALEPVMARIKVVA